MATKNRKNSKKITQQEPKVINVQKVSLAMQKERETQKQIQREKAKKQQIQREKAKKRINGIKSANPVKQKRKRIELISDNGIKSNSKETCDNCNNYAYVWKYSKSNCGKVKLCFKCKERALYRLYKHIEPLDRAISFGSFSKK